MENITYGDLEKKVLSYTPFDIMKLRKAYDYAKRHHDKQKRASGEPYIIHPLNVAYTLACMYADRDTICAGLLHDVLEDSDFTKKGIETRESNKGKVYDRLNLVFYDKGEYRYVNVDGVDYYVVITNGAGQLNVTGLKEGTYDVKVTYLENDKYLQSTNDSAKVIVTKVDTANINVTVENITEGEPAIVKVTVPEDATGNVTVTIGNITKTFPVSGGENEIIILDVPKGEHNVTVTYNGDDKYAPDTATDKITVAPQPPKEGINVDDLGNGTVVVNVPDNATGNVTIKIGNHTYNATVVNGTATIDLVDEVPGAYNATVIYTNNDGLNVTTTKLVHIPKYPTPMSIEVSDANVGDVVKVVVNVGGNVEGNVTIEIDGVNYTAKVEGGKATFNVENLVAGNKTITATYAGDDYYEFNSTTDQFIVSKNNATKGTNCPSD